MTAKIKLRDAASRLPREVHVMPQVERAALALVNVHSAPAHVAPRILFQAAQIRLGLAARLERNLARVGAVGSHDIAPAPAGSQESNFCQSTPAV